MVLCLKQRHDVRLAYMVVSHSSDYLRNLFILYVFSQMQNEREQRDCKGDLFIRLPVEGVGRCCNCTNTCIFSGELSSGSPGLRIPPPIPPPL